MQSPDHKLLANVQAQTRSLSELARMAAADGRYAEASMFAGAAMTISVLAEEVARLSTPPAPPEETPKE